LYAPSKLIKAFSEVLISSFKLLISTSAIEIFFRSSSLLDKRFFALLSSGALKIAFSQAATFASS